MFGERACADKEIGVLLINRPCLLSNSRICHSCLYFLILTVKFWSGKFKLRISQSSSYPRSSKTGNET